MKCPNCNDGCEAEIYCEGCKQEICRGCHGEHADDADDHTLINATDSATTIVVIDADERGEKLAVFIDPDSLDKLRRDFKEFERCWINNAEDVRDDGLKRWLHFGADYDIVDYNAIADRKPKILETVFCALRIHAGLIMRSFEEVDRIIKLFPESHRRWCPTPVGGKCACLGCLYTPGVYIQNGISPAQAITKAEFEMWNMRRSTERMETTVAEGCKLCGYKPKDIQDLNDHFRSDHPVMDYLQPVKID